MQHMDDGSPIHSFAKDATRLVPDHLSCNTRRLYFELVVQNDHVCVRAVVQSPFVAMLVQHLSRVERRGLESFSDGTSGGLSEGTHALVHSGYAVDMTGTDFYNYQH